uniref:Shootin-1 n=1 Tax=Scophthalmus maximus TaxID=52904 RepID=A0A8D3B273_SCOMX
EIRRQGKSFPSPGLSAASQVLLSEQKFHTNLKLLFIVLFSIVLSFAVSFLFSFFPVSQLVIEEVSVIQENLEIERTCRESAEALASKLNRQNRSLKRKSMMLLSHLSPNAIAEINLEDDEEEEEEDGKDLNVASKVCLSPQCHTTISELQSKLELTLKEKRQAETDLEAIRDQLRETREELLKEKNDNTVLIAETLKQKKLLGKYNRVSQFAVEEYKALQDTLSLEQNLRTEAENFGRMMIEKKKLQRQSQILMQSSSPSHALQEALTQVTSLTRDLETQRLGHQNQIKQLEDRLSSCEAQRELTALRRKLDLVEEEKREYSDKCSKTEVEVKDLRFTVEELQKKLQAVTNPPPAPAPPPPPPPPPPPAPAPSSNPLRFDHTQTSFRLDVLPRDADVRQQAVDEMMQRIKRGVQLRPVSQATNRTRRQVTSLTIYFRNNHPEKLQRQREDIQTDAMELMELKSH